MAVADDERVSAWKRATRRLRHPGRPGRTPLASLAAASPATVGALNKNEIRTAEQLWARVSSPGLETGLQRCGADTGLTESLLVDLLLEAARRRPPLVRPADLLVPGIALLAGVLLLLRVGAVLGLPLGSLGPAPLTGTQVVAAEDLPVFHRVTASDLVVRETPRRYGAATEASQVVERYTLQSVPKGQPVSRTALSVRVTKGPAAQVLALPLAPGAAQGEAGAGEEVVLLFAPTAAGVQAGLRPARVQVLLLRIEPEDGQRIATIALSGTALDSVAPLIGASQVYLVQPER